MAVTRTGGFPIGLRRLWSDWQKDLGDIIAFAKEEDFSCLDLGSGDVEAAPAVVEAGLRIGSMDMPAGRDMVSPDGGKRREAVARNAESVKALGALGSINHFVVMRGEPDRSPRENFGYMVESYSKLASVLEEQDARIVIEGCPGHGALCCNPEGYRAFFREMSGTVAGVNYDPSHLIRMGIDPIRFLDEFVERVYHIHAKDTEVFPEGLYEFGHQLPAVFAETPAFGSTYWRYAIPGHGCMRWTEAFHILAAAGYSGCISIELEDVNFNGTEEGEKLGLVLGRRHLEGC